MHSERATTTHRCVLAAVRISFQTPRTTAASTRNAQRYMVAMHQLAALCIATTTLAFVPPQGYKPSHCLRATAPEGADLEELWRAHSKPLLRVGANGVKESHRNSLVELLEAHPYVCVKVNGAKDEASVAAARDALAGDVAVALLTKSNSVLYGKPGRSSSAQKTKMLQVDPADIGKIIGKGGETVRGLIADHGLANVDVDDDGCVTITGSDVAQVDACAARIAELVDADGR